MREKLYHTLSTLVTPFLIGALGGMLRYSSNVLVSRHNFVFSRFLLTIFVGGMMALLAFWFTNDYITSISLQKAIMYVCGMIAPEIVKAIVSKGGQKISDYVDNVLDKK